MAHVFAGSNPVGRPNLSGVVMSEGKRSSDAATQPTDSRAATEPLGPVSPTLHGVRLGTEPVKQADLTTAPDTVLIEALGVSRDMQEILKKAIKRPNLITVSYIDTNGTVQNWWQTRQFQADLVVRTLKLLQDDTEQKLLGRQPGA